MFQHTVRPRKIVFTNVRILKNYSEHISHANIVSLKTNKSRFPLLPPNKTVIVFGDEYKIDKIISTHVLVARLCTMLHG